MTPAEPSSLLECYASGEDDAPDDTRLSPDTAASPAEEGEGNLGVGPYVGQRFPTHDAAYEFYSGFARRCGFSIRRHRTEGKDGVGRGLTRRYFVCHRAGSAPAKPLAGAPKPQRNRSSSRCGCQAFMRIGRGAAAAGAPTEWRVTGFSDHHNHALLGQDKVHLLPAYRVISGADKDRILMFAKSGISVQQMMRIMELEKCVEPGNLPFTEKDVRNLIQSFRKVNHEDGESVDLLGLCKNFKEKDPNFKFEFTKDANNHLQNIAWTYAASVQSYEMFGDAVVFDTTHRLSALDMVLGIWVGLNNYGMPCFFGCVLVREENQESFAWALQVFLNFMNRKAPQTILTDQIVCIKEAIEKELPSTKHALCIWLIAARFPSWFNANLRACYNDWKNEFDRLYYMDNTMAFDLGWNDMVSCYGLNGNRHIASLFESRNLWALPYLRGHFSAGLTSSPAVSESINAFIQRFTRVQTCLANFIEQVSVAVKDQIGEQEMRQQNVQNISLKTASPIEGHAAAVLTPYAFSKLQDELVASSQYESFRLEGSVFLVRQHTEAVGGCSVTWNQREELISCSCQMFESSGILCRHALRVLSTLNYLQIPDLYLPVRWHRIQPPPPKSFNGTPHPQGVASERMGALQSMVSVLVTEAAKSNERMDLATHEVSVLLSRIKQQPVLVHGSGENAHRLQ
ncbi:Protein FAR1-RELATED SEQUENCE 11 [Dichanthelium oligosanthes]|uniref:Protein FAR1-RELATED SEQUENCE n=1 Tax=Dichanthelium oligosanthes TaxID=888268 RepID=A0A1E5UX49_9POAL|nr:Protein FAR1-RELATED SEQUENCE 11 [Dichanthelium oligosanthes]